MKMLDGIFVFARRPVYLPDLLCGLLSFFKSEF